MLTPGSCTRVSTSFTTLVTKGRGVTNSECGHEQCPQYSVTRNISQSAPPTAPHMRWIAGAGAVGGGMWHQSTPYGQHETCSYLSGWELAVLCCPEAGWGKGH